MNLLKLKELKKKYLEYDIFMEDKSNMSQK